MREQRKLAAVLAADVVGYSRLMGRDEVGTLARLKERRAQQLEPALARNGGRLVKLTGDGALAEFGSAVDALRAAIEFQQAVEQANAALPEEQCIVFRVGLHVGDLIVDGDDLYGDGVNVAARLEAEAPAGGIVVSGALHEAPAGKLQTEFVDLGRLSLKNIGRQVQAYRVEWRQGRYQPSVMAVATGGSAVPSLPEKPSIAVLPFQNMSGDSEQEYFVDGLVEDIITALSRFKSLFVIARNSSFSYKGGAVDIQRVGRELGVRYVLEGSVRKASHRVRVTAQLIEAAMGSHVWAEKYDRALADIFELQDELTHRIVANLQPEISIVETERVKRKSESELTAWDCYLRAADLIRTHDAANVDKAEALLKIAIGATSDFAPAYAKLSACRLKAHYMTFHQNDAALDEALQHAQRAIRLDPDEALGYDALASVLQRVRKMDPSIANARKAIELSPTLMAAYGTLISSLAFSGRASEAIEAYRISERLSPRDPDRSQRLMGLMLAQFVAGNYEEAIRAADEHILLQPKWGNTRRWRAASLALLGKLDEARLAIAEYLKMEPHYTISVYNRIGMLQRPEDKERLIEGFRLAGLPE